MYEEIISNLRLCVRKYQEAYDNAPNAVILEDQTLKILNEAKMLKNSGRQKGADLGIALKTENAFMEVYLIGRFKQDENIKAGKERKLYKAGGICPLTLATHVPWYSLKKRIISKKNFEYFLRCDIGVPAKQLEHQLSKQIKEQT
jgi:hypothetical protein